jgi:hypothetical protein
VARQTKVFLIHDLEDKRFIQGKVMVPDSVTEADIADFIYELEGRLYGLLQEESVDG